MDRHLEEILQEAVEAIAAALDSRALYEAKMRFLGRMGRIAALYKKLKDTLSPYLCHYEEQLVETNKGIGMVTELLRDSDLTISKPLAHCPKTPEIKAQIDDFCQRLIDNDIFFYDFNLQNFVIQNLAGKTQLKFIDMKSYRHYKPWTYLGLEKFVPYFARRAMKQRIKKLNQLLQE